jgi:pimeloyl-ACP methyl ester carboxylesterase
MVDYPEDVAGAVLIDPTPVNEPKSVRSLAPASRLIAFLLRAPLLRRGFGGLMTRSVTKDTDPSEPDAQAAVAAILETSQWGRLVRQFGSMPQQCADLTGRLRTHPGPIVVIGADRKAGNRIRRAQEDASRLLGARYEVWPGAVHTEHLRQPRAVMTCLQSIVDEVMAARGSIVPGAQAGDTGLVSP